MRGLSIRPLLTAALILGLMAVALIFPNQRYSLVTLAQQYNTSTSALVPALPPAISVPGLSDALFGQVAEVGSSIFVGTPGSTTVGTTITEEALSIVSPELGETIVIPADAIRRNPRLIIPEGEQFSRNPADRVVLQARSEDLNILVFYLYTRDGSDVFQFNFYDRLGNLIDDRLMLVVPASGPTTWVYESNRPSR